MAQYKIAIDAFIRSIDINKKRPICLLLGAGASISSGMPSAERCIWEWKREIFITKNPLLRETVGELSLQGTKDRIQKWLDQRGEYPALNSPEEYSFYAEECYITEQDRRSFFQQYVEAAKPHIGYRLLPLLAQTKIIKTVWTTNFDGLVARACHSKDVVCIEVGLDNTHRITRQHSEGELRVVSLHGDYRYDELKNTDEQLRHQEEALKNNIEHELQDYDLVVIGYSGRDRSLMNVLENIFSKAVKSRLFWCGYGETISQPVMELLELARKNNRDAFYVSTEGFDDTVERISRKLLDGNMLSKALAEIQETPCITNQPAKFVAPESEISSLIKSNAYPLFKIPSQFLKVVLKYPEGNFSYIDWLNSKVDFNQVVLSKIGKEIIAFADVEDLKKYLGEFYINSPTAINFSRTDIINDTRVQSLVRRGLIQSIVKNLNLSSDQNKRIWNPNIFSIETHNGSQYKIIDALILNLDFIKDEVYVTFKPDLLVLNFDESLPDHDAVKTIKNKKFGYQHNKEYAQILEKWADIVTKKDLLVSGGGVFHIGVKPLYAGLVNYAARKLPTDFNRHATQKGLIIQDAKLIFCSSSISNEIAHVNPLKGLVENRPWDYKNTSSGLCPEICINVISTPQDAGFLNNLLRGLHDKAFPEKSEQDYLHPFHGFTSAFGVPISFPRIGENTWRFVDEALSAQKAIDNAKNLANRICYELDSLKKLELRTGTVVIIYIPKRWESLTSIKSEYEYFDLHDYIKAYAAQQGISTQFIREKTVNSSQSCRVKWWLSLAFYVKAMRTPWRLESIDNHTAFVGIGYSINRNLYSENSKRIILGCSHIYSARGEGMQFQLGRIENPIIHHHNPYMSEEDARRTGEKIRQMFFDAKMQLPRRVVIHKRTAFTEEEQRGFTQGLEGVEDIELIEINFEDSFRYLSSKLVNSKLEIDGFPIARGTVIVQSSNTALLWVHGATPSAQNPSFKYFQGKRRIPVPLVIKRYIGQSDISQLANEILGLSKMNWNTFDYYSRLPVTLESANDIARIGVYFNNFSPMSYDYRLLI
ncbi:SIR2 family protein [Acinetobacter lactucae]|uniref:SIR2 family protein n=1 Tax=Acinetobacter lactucae TaxID=1785128 RepID=UPI0039F714B9